MGSFFTTLFNNLKIIRVRDFIDIAIVAFAIYKGISLFRETRASKLIKGILVLIIFTQIARVMQLNAVNFILENTLQIGLIAILIVFQPELRRALEKVGTASIKKIIKINDDSEENDIGEVCRAASKLASSKTGALIIIERTTKLGDIMSSGIIIDSKISEGLLINIFVPNTPLHDGAVVIGDNRIKAAACFLPLTQDNTLSKELGTRHRAAVGISEVADCLAIVVSEETGKISLAHNGKIYRDFTGASLHKKINEFMESDRDNLTDNLKKIKKDRILSRTVKKK
ncbi:MAG: diadenylate cyclase CdaA [Clostridia bacterium]|nr:diadenylate cyclase CdaA [Clostridia bacterium]